MSIDIPALIDAAGGEIVGKIRLQKMVYLLDQLGAMSGFLFEYHHYGPYSEDLAEAVDDDVIFGRIEEDQRRRVSDGVSYVVYRSSNQGEQSSDTFSQPAIRGAIEEMNRQSMTILELAATIHWLAFKEKIRNWREELIRRKGVKTEHGRAERAIELLEKLKLRPD
jgi:uncharacterized protein YwgA